MLPDYPDVKDELLKLFNNWLAERVYQHLGPLFKTPRYPVFEGTSTSMIRPCGQEDITPLKPYTSGFEVTLEEVPTLTFPEIFARLDRLAQNMADQLAQLLYETASNTADSVGNTVDLRRVGLTPQGIFEILEKIEIFFDEDGNPELPSIHVHPNSAETIRTTLMSLQSDPELRAQYDEILQRKKENWRVREAHRKLVG